jgi:hypothetical protein
MHALLQTVISEHRRLHDLLRELMLLGARAEAGDVHAWHQLTQIDVKRELDLHARRERAEIERVFPGSDPASVQQRRKLDALHQVEARSAILLRVAADLGDAVLHIGEIVEALTEEERQLVAAQAEATA